MIRQSLILLLFMGFLMSCGRTNRLSEKDYEWMPYEGNETLVFRSNAGNVDTIFLLKKDTLFGYSDQYSIVSSKYEVLSVFCKHTDPYSTAGEKSYNENYFFTIIKEKEDDVEIRFGVSAEKAHFYCLSRLKIDSLDGVTPSSIETQYGQYKDVYIFNGEDILDYGKRSDFITKIYWSKSNGLVRYDKKDSVYWELTKKY